MVRFSRYAHAVLTTLFGIGVITQVFFIGLTLLGGQPSLEAHIGLGHGLGLFAILMLIFVYVGRFSSVTKRTTWLGFVIYILLADVVIFMRDSVPLVAALHPVLAVILLVILYDLARRAWAEARQASAEAASAQASAD